MVYSLPWECQDEQVCSRAAVDETLYHSNLPPFPFGTSSAGATKALYWHECESQLEGYLPNIG